MITRIIDCEFIISADHGPVKIGDTKEGTFAIRVVKALESAPGRMVISEGDAGEKAVWGKRANWADGSYLIPAGGSLTLRYRVFIHHGDFQQAGVAGAYRRYAAGQQRDMQ